jgi:hypothetical protein
MLAKARKKEGGQQMEKTRKPVGTKYNHYADTLCSDCGGKIPMSSPYNLYEQTTIRQEKGYAMKETEMVRVCFTNHPDERGMLGGA